MIQVVFDSLSLQRQILSHDVVTLDAGLHQVM